MVAKVGLVGIRFQLHGAVAVDVDVGIHTIGQVHSLGRRLVRGLFDIETRRCAVGVLALFIAIDREHECHFVIGVSAVHAVACAVLCFRLTMRSAIAIAIDFAAVER